MTFADTRTHDDDDWMPGGRPGQLLTAVSLAIAAGLIILVGVRWYAYQWDFHMFYGAARDFAAGGNPYRGEGLSFYHPPIMLYVYRLFTFMPVPVAITVWYIAKIAALTALIWIWHTDFVRLRLQGPTILFFIFAYQAAIYSDLVAGNVSIFEELLLWFGFSRLLRGRLVIFAICVIAVAQVKITPIFFTVLFLVACDTPRWRAFAATIAGFAAVFSLNQWLQPALFRSFWTVSASLDERGDNQSVLALFRDISDRVLGEAFTRSSRLDEVLFLVAVAGVCAISLGLVVRYRQAQPSIDGRLLICFSCFVFALISPRLKTYTFIILLAPTLYLLSSVRWRRRIPLAAAVMVGLVVFPQPKNLLPFRAALEVLNAYLPLLAAILLWGGYASLLAELSAPRDGWKVSLSED
jgi:hypothetical protein